MKTELQNLEKSAIEGLENVTSENELIDYKNTILGKNGSLTHILKGLKNLSGEERSEIGTLANTLRDRLNLAFDEKKEQIKQIKIAEKIEQEYEDVTAPAPVFNGSLHPITIIQKEVEDSFLRMGFDIYQSSDLTTEYLNFDAVNVPKTHPARDMQDTFWLEGNGNVLATQTSCMQNLIFRNKKAPIRAIIPGRVFRNEDVDATHDNTFYQVEGVVVDENISLGNLKYTITTMLSDLFGKEVKTRMRPGYFPFVEPGMEVDFSCPFCGGHDKNCRVCKGSGWIEFMGAGLIHPHVLEEGGIDPKKYSGFAFGFGLNRLVMIKYGIPDMRYFMHADIRFLKQF